MPPFGRACFVAAAPAAAQGAQGHMDSSVNIILITPALFNKKLYILVSAQGKTAAREYTDHKLCKYYHPNQQNQPQEVCI